MNLTHLKYIIEVERQGSVTKAAAVLYVGQPNLSKIIRDTEQELGVKIFRRTSKGVVPTAEGEQLLSYAKAALAQIEKIEQLSGGGSVQMMLPPGYPAVSAAKLLETLPDDRRCTGISAGGTDDALDAVAQRSCSYAVIRVPAGREELIKAVIAEKGLGCRRLGEYETVVLAGAGSLPSDSRELSDEQLAGMTRLCSEEEARGTDSHRITVGRDVDVYGLLVSLPGAYMISPPLPQIELDRLGLVQKPYAGAEHLAELLIYSEE